MKLRKPTHRETVQFIKYAISGTAYFWSGYLTFWLCYSGLGWDWWPAKMLADVVGWTLNYVLQRFWAFNDSRLKRHELQVAGKYSLLTIFNFGLDYVIVGSLYALGVSPYIGLFVSAAFFTVWNYAWYRWWVFYASRKKAHPLDSLIDRSA